MAILVSSVSEFASGTPECGKVFRYWEKMFDDDDLDNFCFGAVKRQFVSTSLCIYYMND